MCLTSLEMAGTTIFFVFSISLTSDDMLRTCSLLRRGSQWGFRCKNPLGKVSAGAKERDPLSGEQALAAALAILLRLHSLRTADSPHLKPLRASAEERVAHVHSVAPRYENLDTSSRTS